MAMVKLPNGDMWDPDKMDNVAPANQASPEEKPDPQPYKPERLDAEVVSGWSNCPWCGMAPSDEETMAEHVERLHQVEISQDIVEARSLRGLQ